MKPHHWPLAALGVSAAAAITLVIVVGSKNPAVNLPIMIGIPFAATYLAHLVSKRVPHQVLFEFRVDPRPSWYTDAVEVTGSGLEITVAASGSRRTTPLKVSYGFADLRGIGTRAAVPGERPWITLSDGRGVPVPDGEVVVLRTFSGEQVLPVENPRKFVSVLRSRVPNLPEVHFTPTPQPDGHLAEVGAFPRSPGEPATPVEGPAGTVGGPPLVVRWLVGAALALTGTVVLPAVALLTTERVVMLGWVAVAGLVWVLNRNVPRVWGRVALLPVPATVLVASAERGFAWVLLLVLCPLLGYLGGRMFRLGTGLGKSVEVRVPLRNGGELYVQRDRLVHKLNRSHYGGAPQRALWLGELTLVQPGATPDVEDWPVPGGLTQRVGAGPLLRLVARPQQWILPLPQARELAELIRSRQDAPARPQAVSVEQWRELTTWAVRRTSGSPWANWQAIGIGWRLMVAAALANFAWMFLAFGLWIGVLVTGVPVLALVADWWRVRDRVRLAEHHALPPGSPDWGEIRPDHAPLYRWQPWRH